MTHRTLFLAVAFAALNAVAQTNTPIAELVAERHAQQVGFMKVTPFSLAPAKADRDALLSNVLERSTDAEERKQADTLLGFLTPIVKGLLTEWGNECTYHALQCFGGHGYVREWGMEQLARDARITTIYEGTTGIQALDLLGRKTMQLQGAGLQMFLKMIQEFCTKHAADASLTEFVLPLAEIAKQWGELTMEVGKKAMANADEVGAASVDYLFYSGYVALAYWWAKSVAAAEAGDHPESFRTAKRETARFYFARILPRTLSHAAAMRAGSGSLMALDAALFDS